MRRKRNPLFIWCSFKKKKLLAANSMLMSCRTCKANSYLQTGLTTLMCILPRFSCHWTITSWTLNNNDLNPFKWLNHIKLNEIDWIYEIPTSSRLSKHAYIFAQKIYVYGCRMLAFLLLQLRLKSNDNHSVRWPTRLCISMNWCNCRFMKVFHSIRSKNNNSKIVNAKS